MIYNKPCPISPPVQHRHISQLSQKYANLNSIACGTIVSSCLCILLSGKAQSMLGDVVQNSRATVGFMTCDDQLEQCHMQQCSSFAGLF